MPPLQTEPPMHSNEIIAQVQPTTGSSSSHPMGSESKPKIHKKKPRSVRFASKVDVYPIICRHDMSPEEVTKVWMDRYDRRDNKSEIHNTIFLMRSGLTMKLNEDDFFCPRGLEHFLNHTTEQKNTCKKSIGIALAMQRILRKAGTSNPSMIARAYHKYTVKSQEVAHTKALYDQAFVSWISEKDGKHK